VRRNSNFFMMPLNWNHDPDVVDLPPTTQVFWLGLIGLCQSSGNGGVMTWAQVHSFARSFQRGHDAVMRLTSRGSLSVMHPTGGELAVDMQRTVPGDAVVVVRNASRWLLDKQPSTSLSAGKATSSGAKSEQTPDRAPAHVKKEREIEREEDRTPSGSVRSSSARAAPRSAGGAARPAPIAGSAAAGRVDPDDDEDLTPMSRADAIAAAKTAIRNGQRNSPYSTGRDVKLSRYDPDRPIIPLRSGFKIDGGAE